LQLSDFFIDYDRTHFANKEVQQRHFRMSWSLSLSLGLPNSESIYLGSQLSLAKKHHLPLFLHSRAAHTDFIKILREEGFGKEGGKAVGAKGGVVHSFTGTVDEVKELVSHLPSLVHISTFSSDGNGFSHKVNQVA
jgi:TatD DNase family protein